MNLYPIAYYVIGGGVMEDKFGPVQFFFEIIAYLPTPFPGFP